MTYNTTRKCCYVGYITQAVVINFAPLLFYIFREEFNISYALLGTLTLINFVTQLAVDVISMFLVDKMGFRKSAVLSQLFAAAGLIMMPVLAYMPGMNYLGLCAATVLYSIGAGLIEVVINPIITALPQEDSGESLILTHSFYCWGQLAVVLVSTVAIKIFGSDAWCMIAPAWGLIPFINAIVFMKTPIVETQMHEKTTDGIKLFSNKTFIVITVLMVCAGGAELAMAQWASIFAQNALGVDKLTGDLLGPCLFALFMGIGRTIHGVLGDKLNFSRHVYINCALCIVCYLVAALSSNAYVALMGCAVCGYAISLMWPGVVSLAAKIFPDEGSAMYSIIAMFGDIGCSIAPYFTGLVASMAIWGDSGLKAGMIINVIYPLLFAGMFTVLKIKVGENKKILR